MGAQLTLQAHQLTLSLGGKRVVEAADLTVRAGEVLGVIGANGSGKTTLLKGLAGLVSPDAGTLSLDGSPLHTMPLRERARRLAYLPQNPECHWPLSAERVVALGRLPFAESEAETARAVEKALHAVDAVAFRHRLVWELSGGEQARVFLARALVGEPMWLLADEPGAGLDPYHQLQLMELLRARADAGAGVAVVLHDLGLAARFCHRLVALKEGRVIASGLASEVLQPEVLAEAHGIVAYQTKHEDAPVLVPWRRI